MLTRIARIAPLALLLGCPVSVGSVDEDNFAEKAAQFTCKQMKECSPIEFYVDPDDLGIDGDAADQYPNGSMEDCVDFYTEAYEDIQDAADDADCDFDEDKANECFAGGTCKGIAENIEDTQESCSEIFDC
jgi:hypothetical protein